MTTEKPAASAAPIELPKPLVEFIDEWKEKPGNLIMILHRVQEEFGYVPKDVKGEGIILRRFAEGCEWKRCVFQLFRYLLKCS